MSPSRTTKHHHPHPSSYDGDPMTLLGVPAHKLKGLLEGARHHQSLKHHTAKNLSTHKQHGVDPRSYKNFDFDNSLLHHLTWRTEGDGGRSTLKCQLPMYQSGEVVGNSGITIGRGCDLGQKSKADIQNLCKAAGIHGVSAKLFIGAAGLHKEEAKEYFLQYGKKIQITAAQQNILFGAEFDKYQKFAKETYTKDINQFASKNKLVQAKRHLLDWDQLPPQIRGFLVDLRFRGDSVPGVRKRFHALVVKYSLDPERNLGKFLNAVRNRESYVTDVPKDRFDRRIKFLNTLQNG